MKITIDTAVIGSSLRSGARKSGAFAALTARMAGNMVVTTALAGVAGVAGAAVGFAAAADTVIKQRVEQHVVREEVRAYCAGEVA